MVVCNKHLDKAKKYEISFIPTGDQRSLFFFLSGPLWKQHQTKAWPFGDPTKMGRFLRHLWPQNSSFFLQIPDSSLSNSQENLTRDDVSTGHLARHVALVSSIGSPIFKRLDRGHAKIRKRNYWFTGSVMYLSRLRHYKTAEAGNKPSYEAGKLYLLQIFLEMGQFLNIQENRKCSHMCWYKRSRLLKYWNRTGVFCIFLPIKDYNVWLHSLELWTRSQFLEISF